MFTLFGSVQFSLQKNVFYNDLLWSHYMCHKKGLVFMLWSQKRCHKPRIEKMLQNCSTNSKECKKLQEPIKWMPYKTAEAQRRTNKMFPKKRKCKYQLISFLTFYMMSAFLYHFLFNHFYDVAYCSYKSCNQKIHIQV